ncbi:MAG: hypothetical protein LBS31_01690 [Candidatus Adiutrix sp.]|nr:hypothetical protein [Candidatus Adiutrix sp.]
MRKMRLPVFLLLLSAVAAPPAWARVVDFGIYTADVPAGWLISEQDGLAVLASSDRNAVFFITTGMSIPRHRAKIAEAAARYEHIIKADPAKNVTLTRIPGQRVAVTIYGDHPDRTKIYYSIKLKDP